MGRLSTGELPPRTVLPTSVPCLSVQRACFTPDPRGSLASSPLSLGKPNSVLFIQLSRSGLRSSLGAPERLGVPAAPGQGQLMNTEEVLVAPANCCGLCRSRCVIIAPAQVPWGQIWLQAEGSDLRRGESFTTSLHQAWKSLTQSKWKWGPSWACPQRPCLCGPFTHQPHQPPSSPAREMLCYLFLSWRWGNWGSHRFHLLRMLQASPASSRLEGKVDLISNACSCHHPTLCAESNSEAGQQMRFTGPPSLFRN